MEPKTKKTLLTICAIIGGVALIAGIAYAVYYFLKKREEAEDDCCILDDDCCCDCDCDCDDEICCCEDAPVEE